MAQVWRQEGMVSGEPAMGFSARAARSSYQRQASFFTAIFLELASHFSSARAGNSTNATRE